MDINTDNLTQLIKSCTICRKFLPHGCNPVFAFSEMSKIAIIGQAPGIRVHKSSIPWDDKSGENLRDWLGIESKTFYNKEKIAIVPMGFCYPGKGKSGDLPPRPECAPQWHPSIFKEVKGVELTILIGQYAQQYYLKSNIKKTLTETVKNYQEYLPNYLVLPHPSPRNNIWMSRNPWFKKELLPFVRKKIKEILHS